VSFRGSTQVLGPTELALWARERDSGLAEAIVNRPRVSLVYYGPGGPGPMFLSIEGRARVAPELNGRVWAAMIDGERQRDPERQGIAVVIDVDSVAGAGGSRVLSRGRHAFCVSAVDRLTVTPGVSMCDS
jgi:hypothetical protein